MTSRNRREGRYLGRFGCWVVLRDGRHAYVRRRHFRTRDNDALRVPAKRRAARRA